MADFDPDAYLAAKAPKPGGFDPDAYMAAKKIAPAVEMAAPHEPPPKEPGFFERAGQSLRQGAHAVANVAGDVAHHPLDTFRNPSKRRELERGIDDMVTLGYGQKLAGRIGHALGDTADVDLTATQAPDAEQAPGYRTTGNLVGSFLPGAASAVGKAGGALASKALNVPVRGALGAAGMGSAKALLGYEASAPLAAGLSSDAEGNRLRAAREAATDPLGLLASGIGGAVAEGGAHKVQHSKGAEARRFIEERGGHVGVMTPGEGGPFEQMQVPGNSDADIGAQAQHSAEKVRTDLDKYRGKVASQPYEQAVNAIPPEQAAQLVDVAPVYHNLVESYYHPGTAPDVAAKVKHEIDIMEARYRRADGSVVMTQDHLNGLRKTLAGMAQVGESTKGKLNPLQQAYHEAKALVDQGPYAEANRLYHQGTVDADESLKLLDLKRSSKPGVSTADVNKVRLKANRMGQNTVTAGADKPKLDRFVEKHPDMAAELEKAELLRKQADLSFHVGAPAHGGLIERTAGAVAGPAAAIAASTMAGHGSMGALGVGALMAAHNAKPIAGRLLYPVAQATNTGGIGGKVSNLVRAAQLKKQRDANAARALMGGR